MVEAATTTVIINIIYSVLYFTQQINFDDAESHLYGKR